jgi:hypothetical protein
MKTTVKAVQEKATVTLLSHESQLLQAKIDKEKAFTIFIQSLTRLCNIGSDALFDELRRKVR